MGKILSIIGESLSVAFSSVSGSKHLHSIIANLCFSYNCLSEQISTLAFSKLSCNLVSVGSSNTLSLELANEGQKLAGLKLGVHLALKLQGMLHFRHVALTSIICLNLQDPAPVPLVSLPT